MIIERHDPEVGIKVVPMYIEGEHVPVEDELAPIERTRTAAIGILALALAALTLAALATAIVIASSGGWSLGTIIAYGAIGLSVLAIVGGASAVILGRGRRWGVIAAVLGVFANPLVLLIVLRFFGGIETG